MNQSGAASPGPGKIRDPESPQRKQRDEHQEKYTFAEN
jgi:hypothetical protein